ncbi:MAG: PLP-dependent aminotransferase family protein [Candidatus Thiodiazotropha sp. (ex Epidulcina cf. delphinae)]|nr:PLP-dependent aminotransferase family protein [Candidatus Thiodiazotropha sp. (ex Epidulcina cf. delphinae)]
MDYLYERLASELAEQIGLGLFLPGDRLPGVRAFSGQHNISVATAVAVYRRLEDEGYIEARPRSGFYVRARARRHTDEPGISSPKNRPSPVSGQELALQLVKAANDTAMTQLGAAVPAPSFLPTRAIERAVANANRCQRHRNTSYEFPPGVGELRRQIARRMAENGCRVGADEIVITHGCQESLTLALRAVTSPGDVVAIESPTFYGLLQVIDSLGLEALEIPTHPQDGVSLEALQLALEQWPVKACVLVPNYSNPLGYCMSEKLKRALVALLSQHRIPLIEDDVYGDLGFTQRRPDVCKSYDKTGDVLHCASFSKTLSPGLRVGWIAAGRYQEKVEYLKFVTNLATSTLPQLAVADLLESGLYERHLRKMRREYARAVERMIAGVERHFPEGTKVTSPQGGFVIWVELPGETDSFALARNLLKQGISIAPGAIFSATGKYRNFLRLSCACDWDDRIERALATMARLLNE